MQKSKTTRKPSIRQLEDSKNKWKAKAITYRKRKDSLRRRNKEFVQSRDIWKAKYKVLQKSPKELNKLDGEKAAKHHYSLKIIVLIISLYKYGGMSLRSCRHSLCYMFLCLGLSTKVPSHSSVRNWLCKCGMYRIENSPVVKGGYVVYIDESISFGSEKMLLILGVPLEQIPKDRSLSHEDMTILFVGASQEWKAEHIEEELVKVAVKHPIEYVVSDRGNNLRKAYKLLDYIHIEDCTHVIS